MSENLRIGPRTVIRGPITPSPARTAGRPGPAHSQPHQPENGPNRRRQTSTFTHFFYILME